MSEEKNNAILPFKFKKKHMLPVFGDSRVSEYIIKFWLMQFKKKSFEDDYRSTRPFSAVIGENMASINKNIL